MPDEIETGLRQTTPQRFIAIELHHGLGKLGRMVRDNHLLARHDRCAFDGDSRRDRGQTRLQRRSDFPLDTGTVAQRRNRDPAAMQQRIQIRHITQNLDPVAGECGDLGGHRTADNQKPRIGQRPLHQRPDLLREVQNSIAVRRVLIGANEQDVCPLGKCRNVEPLRDLAHQRDYVHLCGRQFLPDQFLFERADDNRRIRGGNRGEFARAHLLGLFAQSLIVGQLCLALQAQEVHIHHVEHDLGTRRQRADQGKIPLRNISAAQHHHIKFVGDFLDHGSDGVVVREPYGLNTEFLKVLGVAASANEVALGNERDPIAQLVKYPHQIERFNRTGILVRRGCLGIDVEEASRTGIDSWI